MMTARLTHIDGKLPNLALMGASHLLRRRGYEVHFRKRVTRDLFEPRYDLVLGSAIFSRSAPLIETLRREFPGAIIGGTGSSNRAELADVLGAEPDGLDYSIYPGFRASLGFTQRGCRLRCKFCVVPEKEGRPRSVATIADIWRGDPWPKHLHLLDNDFFGQAREEWRARIREIRDGGFKVSFTQGINARLLTDEVAEAVASVDYRDDGFIKRRLYTAWDNLKDEGIFFRGVERLERAGVPSSHLLVYMLVGFDQTETWERVLYRIGRMLAAGMRPFPMIYGDKDRELPPGGINVDLTGRTLGHFQRWAIRPAKLGIPFHEYDAAAKGWADGRQLKLEDAAA
jgi:hypothetical protein